MDRLDAQDVTELIRIANQYGLISITE